MSSRVNHSDNVQLLATSRVRRNTPRGGLLNVPHLRAVIPDGAVGGELAHARRVEDGLARPSLGLTPTSADFFLARDISLIIREHEEWIVVEQVVHERTKEIRFAARQPSLIV